MPKNKNNLPTNTPNYSELISSIGSILAQGRRLAHQTVNTILTTTYWQIGKQIVEFEQGGKERAKYGSQLLQKISTDLTKQFGEGFSYRNVRLIRQFYLAFPNWQTLSANSPPLSWSHYVRLMSIENPDERKFYEVKTKLCNVPLHNLVLLKRHQPKTPPSPLFTVCQLSAHRQRSHNPMCHYERVHERGNPLGN
ncbi:MAG: DUF1016 N-terminal domain-containing protein [bacterium]